jgi:DtxR family transcriptional regulator, Mn-dependent transcriptional regulator
MIPSSTVENYLKAILLHQVPDGTALVPMGQIAASLGVTPGTATTMVKALAESGLVLYEPYTGVRLAPAGEKLAALVLRRHRLVELFLVQVMGLSWDEVHEEAEKLEHVVSERLMERMDEMLGRPEVDPHGDPIPDADGAIPQRDFQTLLTCPLHIPVTVTRVLDQDAEFLRFIEHHELKPGQAVEVEARDPMADSVRLRGPHDRRTTIGTRAASKLLVDVASALFAVLTLCGGVARAQTPDEPATSSPFGIADNSFLVEEAFNQEAGIFQNIFVFERSGPRGWNAGFVQEWPVTTMRHQLSYTLNFARDGGSARFSGTGINYRYQLWTEDAGRPAFSPRGSLLLSRDDDETGQDEGAFGLEMNLPFSKRVGATYFHWNGGVRWYPHVWTGSRLLPVEADHVALTTPFAAGSAIYAVRPMFNLMLEAVLESEESVTSLNRTERQTIFTILPGARGGWNLGDAQLVVGLAVPVVRQAGETETGILGYLSYELPFGK